MKKIRLLIFQAIQPNKERKILSLIVEWFIIVLILINVVLIILDTFSGIPDNVRWIFYYIEIFSIIVFTIEYLLRLLTADYLFPNISPAKARKKYIFSFMAIIDFLAILPFYIPFLLSIDLRVIRMIRLLRLVRLLKVNRYTSALIILGNVLKRKSTQLLSSILIMLILIVMASILMHNIEHEAQPDVFENAFSGLWWAIATLTRTSLGNLHPITAMGRLLGAIVSVLGIGLIAVPTGIISSGFVSQNESDKKIENQKEKIFCSYCGEKIN